MARPYHSPSSIALGMSCPRAWAERYLRGVVDPELPWSAFEGATWDRERTLWALADGTTATSKQKSTALGKATHAVFEAWHTPGAAVDWTGLPGEIARSGAHLVPHPEACARVITEGPIGREPIPAGPDVREGMTHGLRVHGVLWAGLKDLVAWPTPSERARLGVPAGHELLLSDYKTTASIEEYTLTAEELLADPQAALYTIDVAALVGVRSVPLNWVYLENKKRRIAAATRAVQSVSRALEVLEPCADLALKLDTLTSPEEAEQNTDACMDYGPPGKINCQYHVKNGGTCNARTTIKQRLLTLRKKEGTDMALTPELQAKLDQINASKAQKAGALESVPESAPEPAPETAPEPAPEPAPAKPSASAPKTQAKAPDGSAAGNVLALTAKLSAAKDVADRANAAVAECLAEIKAALA